MVQTWSGTIDDVIVDRLATDAGLETVGHAARLWLGWIHRSGARFCVLPTLPEEFICVGNRRIPAASTPEPHVDLLCRAYSSNGEGIRASK